MLVTLVFFVQQRQSSEESRHEQTELFVSTCGIKREIVLRTCSVEVIGAGRSCATAATNADDGICINRAITPSLSSSSISNGREYLPPIGNVWSLSHFLAEGGIGTFAPWHSVQFCCAVIPTLDAAFQALFCL